ncbi:MAG: tryptophan--tRNA ligase [Deltaproteobacteria bacterium]|nr:MAG: tryptophan--tRNA ligase [Deltaproteobacteria bacterium]
MERKRIVSGMRPTGRIHLGHVHGALNNWRSLQRDYQCFYFIADWHALTSEYEHPEIIKQTIKDILIDWIAIGLRPEQSVIFVQSSIKEHSELHLILSMFTPLPWLERNPTYKEQLKEMAQRDLYTYGFLGYPVLQAADILMYKANGVPVGEDQSAHIELTREIARRFNHLYSKVFPLPETLLTPEAKILGTDRRKMSNSYKNAIFISDREEVIKKTVAHMITDPQRARRSDPGRPDFCNVFTFHELYTDREKVKEIEEGCRTATIGCVECKQIMASNLNKALEPLREKRRELEADPKIIEDIIDEGNKKARKIAKNTMEQVREAVKI